jgi:hypothetical protein
MERTTKLDMYNYHFVKQQETIIGISIVSDGQNSIDLADIGTELNQSNNSIYCEGHYLKAKTLLSNNDPVMNKTHIYIPVTEVDKFGGDTK